MNLRPLIDQSFALHSEIVRKLHAEEGVVRCAVCGLQMYWKESCCGHWIKRRHLETAFNVMNAVPLCTVCNGADTFDDVIAEKINSFWGEGATDKLKELLDPHYRVDAVILGETIRELKEALKKIDNYI